MTEFAAAVLLAVERGGGEGAGGDVEAKSWPARDCQEPLDPKQFSGPCVLSSATSTKQSQLGALTKSCCLDPLRRHTRRKVWHSLLVCSRTGIMSKVKPPKSKGIPSKHLHARTAFLYQAATYLTLQTSPNGPVQVPEHLAQTHSPGPVHCAPISLQLGSDLQQVSRKAQLRLSVDVKRTICKRCNTILVQGRTATQTIENASKGGKKPWADVLVLECKVCGGKKKFPVGMERQAKKGARIPVPKTAIPPTSSDASHMTDSANNTSTELDSNTG